MQRLHDESGLTWHQLSQMLGVSRRSLHAWVAVGRISSPHLDRLQRLVRLVHSLYEEDGYPEQVRARLLAPQRGGQSLFDRLVGQFNRGRETAPGAGRRTVEVQVSRRADRHDLPLAALLDAHQDIASPSAELIDPELSEPVDLFSP